MHCRCACVWLIGSRAVTTTHTDALPNSLTQINQFYYSKSVVNMFFFGGLITTNTMVKLQVHLTNYMQLRSLIMLHNSKGIKPNKCENYTFWKTNHDFKHQDEEGVCFFCTLTSVMRPTVVVKRCNVLSHMLRRASLVTSSGSGGRCPRCVNINNLLAVLHHAT